MEDSIKKHEYLEKEYYYEDQPVGNRGGIKWCEHCGEVIPAKTPHSVHKFYPEFTSYPTHAECSDAFIESLN